MKRWLTALGVVAAGTIGGFALYLALARTPLFAGVSIVFYHHARADDADRRRAPRRAGPARIAPSI